VYIPGRDRLETKPDHVGDSIPRRKIRALGAVIDILGMGGSPMHTDGIFRVRSIILWGGIMKGKHGATEE